MISKIHLGLCSVLLPSYNPQQPTYFQVRTVCIYCYVIEPKDALPKSLPCLEVELKLSWLWCPLHRRSPTNWKETRYHTRALTELLKLYRVATIVVTGLSNTIHHWQTTITQHPECTGCICVCPVLACWIVNCCSVMKPPSYHLISCCPPSHLRTPSSILFCKLESYLSQFTIFGWPPSVLIDAYVIIPNIIVLLQIPFMLTGLKV